MSDLLQEAHAPSAFLQRVNDLHQGEVARLEGGVAVKRLATEDGRDGFKVAGAPYGYRGDPDFYGELYRTAEDAVREAFKRSARSTDPESIGGATSISTYGPYTDGGREVRIRDWTTDGRAIVAPSGVPGAEKVVDPASLVRRSPVMYESELREVEQARPGTNFTKIPPQNVKKLAPIIKHYKGMAHPFSTCVRDQMKHGLSRDHANRRCAVVKDLGEGTTKWRKGGKGKVTEGLTLPALALTESVVGEFVERLLVDDPELAEGILALSEEWSDAARRAAYLSRIRRLRTGGASVLLDHGVRLVPKGEKVHVSSPHSVTEQHPITNPQTIVDAVFRHQEKATRRKPQAWLAASEEPFWLPPLQESRPASIQTVTGVSPLPPSVEEKLKKARTEEERRAILGKLAEEWSEQARAKALAARKAKHPDWNWGGGSRTHAGPHTVGTPVHLRHVYGGTATEAQGHWLGYGKNSLGQQVARVKAPDGSTKDVPTHGDLHITAQKQTETTASNTALAKAAWDQLQSVKQLAKTEKDWEHADELTANWITHYGTPEQKERLAKKRKTTFARPSSSTPERKPPKPRTGDTRTRRRRS